MRAYHNWIGGASVPPSGKTTLTRQSPFDGRELASFALGDADDVDQAVRAARTALDDAGWRDIGGSGRAKLLNRWAELMQAKASELADIEADEVGKPITAARGEIDYGIDVVRYAASLAWSIQGKLMSDEGPDKLGIVLHDPKGVVGLITPWNYPFVCLMMKLPYALAAGCTVVVKPSELTSGTTLEIAALAIEAGIPSGVFNVVTGTGAAVGEALTGHGGINMVSFTGSSAVGKHIARRAADTMKRVSLELGGKSANIVCADADLDAAVEGALLGFTINQGEECCAGSRLFLERSIAEEFLGKLVERVKAVRVGDPRDEATEVGPMISAAHLDRVLAYIEKGKSEGARVMVGGGRLTNGEYARGLFVAPTVFVDVTSDMAIYREEIFGPVVGVVTFDTVDEAIELANGSAYGLAGGVWTASLDKAIGMVRRLRTGMIYVNCYLQTIAQLPFGGMKESGFGRENGSEGLMEFLEVKAAFAKLQTRL